MLTEKRSLENYVHWEAIRAARGVNTDSLRRNRGREPLLIGAGRSVGLKAAWLLQAACVCKDAVEM